MQRNSLHLLFVLLVCLTSFQFVPGQGLRGRLIKKDTLPDEPLKIIEVQSGKKAITLNNAFVGEENWLDGLQLKLKNISGKSIVYLEVEVIVPESVTGDVPLVIPMAFGQKPLAVSSSSSTTQDSIPNSDSIPLTFSESHYAKTRRVLAAKNRSISLDTVEVRIGMVIFDDNTAWHEGKMLRRDLSNPDVWEVQPKSTMTQPPNEFLPQKRWAVYSPSFFVYERIPKRSSIFR